VNRKLLAIYLNDHLAGATVGIEVCGRAAAANRGNEFGAFLEHLRGEIEYDRGVLEDLMDRNGIAKDPVKRGVAWVAEKAGRFKLNGQITGYSPLSRHLELESLAIGVTGKLSLWQTLQELHEEPEVADFDVERFIARAHEQLEGLEEHRRRAARLAFPTPVAA
jgi:hypothetical protein